MPTARPRLAPRLALVGLLLMGPIACGGGNGTGRPTASPTPTTSPPTPQSSPPRPTTPATSPSTPASPTGTRALAIYYVHDTDTGPKLYREFHQVMTGAALVRGAVDAMLHQAPRDPDYTSLWPKATQVRGVNRSGDTVTVDLSQEATRGNAGASFEAISLQQLVYTVTGAAPGVRRVRLLVTGRPVESLWGHVGVGTRPLTRGPQVDVLAPVWLENPAQGATVGRTVKLSGQATVFEATVSWEVRRGGALVKRGFSNASVGGPGRGPWSATVTLPSGSYVARAFESSPKDGRPTFIDDKAFTVR